MIRIHYYKSYRYQKDNKQKWEQIYANKYDTSAEIVKYTERDKLPNLTLIY